ncbi:MAG TPA: BON domain-containing protein [Stellaceae bacterium]|jgi:osmotically-inducible protein OsmY|nr:BON domain-containing protein [Stellaceae bacterium]
MSRLHGVVALACLATLPVGLSGCVGVVVAGGLAGAAVGGYAAGQERGVNGSVSDFTIKTNIETALTQTDPHLQMGVSATVYGGRVLLTGRVDTPQMKATADRIAGGTNGVRALYDEVQVAAAETPWDDTKDAWITAQVRSQMIVDPAIRSVNYTIDAANGSVYLIGSARSQTELDRATRIARYVPGVKRVVSYVEIRSGEPVAAVPQSAPMASPMSDQPGAAAPRAPIEVQKL